MPCSVGSIPQLWVGHPNLHPLRRWEGTPTLGDPHKVACHAPLGVYPNFGWVTQTCTPCAGGRGPQFWVTRTKLHAMLRWEYTTTLGGSPKLAPPAQVGGDPNFG